MRTRDSLFKSEVPQLRRIDRLPAVGIVGGFYILRIGMHRGSREHRDATGNQT